MRANSTLLLSVILWAPVIAGAQSDAAPQQLAERLARPTGTRERAFGLPAPRLLFTRQGDDNACALATLPDVDGRGVPEVVVGWDLSKSGDNLEILSGGSYTDGQPVWSIETGDGISGGYFSDIDQLKSFPDITGDGRPELLTGTSGGGRSATLYDGATGEMLQSFDTYLGTDSGWVYDVESVGDVNGNGTPDFALAVGSDADAVYMVDGGNTGVHHNEIWQFPASDVFYGITVLGDLDQDGVADLAAGTGDSLDDVFALSGADGSQLWMTDLDGTIYDLTTYPDWNDDGFDDVLAGVWASDAGVVLLDGISGKQLWSSGAIDTFIMRVVPTIDINGDGTTEIAVASWANSAFLLNGRDGSIVWETPAGSDVWAIDVLPDINGDAVPEVAFGSFTGFAYLADGATGALLWEHDANGHKVLAIDASSDLDGDGYPEVVIGGQQLSAGIDDLLWVVSSISGSSETAPELAYSGHPVPGGEITLELSGGVPERNVWWLSGANPSLMPLPIGGWLAVTPPQVISTGTVDADGTARLTLTVPDSPDLVGRALYAQAIEADTNMSNGRSSNRVGFEVVE